MWWLVALIVLLAGLVVVDLRLRPRPPLLILVRDREEELEGLVRRLSGRGAPLYILDLGSRDGSRALAARLERTLPEVITLEGDVRDALAQCPTGVVTVVAFCGPWRSDELLRYL